MVTGASLRAQIKARVGRLEIDVEVDTGAGTLVLVGPNGAGKSTLLSLLLGALAVERGCLSVGDTVLLDTSAHVDVPVEQRHLGYVPQDYALFQHLSVRENIDFALGCGSPPLHPSQRNQQVEAMLEELGLLEHAGRSTRSLSGGEKQRVALARALSVAPRALLLDEPLAALDVHSRHEVRAFLGTYLARLALPTIVVTHDAEDAQRLGQRVAVMEAGTITQVGTWAELVAQPASRFVAEFVASARA